MAGTHIDIRAADGGKFRGYLCLPRSGKGPGLVVEQEIFGINENVRLVCENYANEGFLSNTEYAIHPDNPGHSRFHAGPVEVWVRALVCGRWTDARIITIQLE